MCSFMTLILKHAINDPCLSKTSILHRWIRYSKLKRSLGKEVNMKKKTILEQAAEMQEELVKIRRYLHQYPELGNEMNQTIRFVKQKLEDLKVENFWDEKQGLVGLIRGERPGGCVLLRADMDGLPIQEEQETSYRSERTNRMHACGHDAHTAWLLGAAAILMERRDEICGCVKLAFQPCEEGEGKPGAREMIEGGILKNPDVDVAVAAHVSPDIEAGKYSVEEGGVTTAPGVFKIEVHGRGGHAAKPEGCVDPILVLNQIYNSISSLQRVSISPARKAVISVTQIEAGHAFNVIPETGTMTGTIRTFQKEDTRLLAQKIKEVSEAVGAAFGAKVVCHYTIPIGASVNDNIIVRKVRGTVQKVLGEEALFKDPHLFMGGDDFSYYTEAVPSCYFFTGVRNENCIWPIHHCRFDLDESCLYRTAAVLAQFAIRYLKHEREEEKNEF